MNTSRWIWGTVGIAAALSTLLFIAGFGYALHQILFPQASADFVAPAPAATAQELAQAKDKLNLVALGDSLTAGTGDSTGKGYVNRVREKLAAQTGKPVYVLNNLAIPGYTTERLIADLELTKTQEALADADMVLLTIGGNDIFAGGAGIFTNEEQQEFNPQAARERVGPALERIERVLELIHQANPEAPVIYVGLYHPFLDLDPQKEGSLVVQDWNSRVFAMTNKYRNMIFVPTYDLFEQNLLKYLSRDHFHPNGDGYERIAERIAQILK